MYEWNAHTERVCARGAARKSWKYFNFIKNFKKFLLSAAALNLIFTFTLFFFLSICKILKIIKKGILERFNLFVRVRQKDTFYVWPVNNTLCAAADIPRQTKILIYTQTVYNDLSGTRGGFELQKFKTEPQNGGRYWQVVLIRW